MIDQDGDIQCVDRLVMTKAYQLKRQDRALSESIASFVSILPRPEVSAPQIELNNFVAIPKDTSLLSDLGRFSGQGSWRGDPPNDEEPGHQVHNNIRWKSEYHLKTV